jgi:hypothetical protein
MTRKRTKERRDYDFASMQIRWMVELTREVHPDVGFYARLSSDEVNILNGKIQILRDWLDELAGFAALRSELKIS